MNFYDCGIFGEVLNRNVHEETYKICVRTQNRNFYDWTSEKPYATEIHVVVCFQCL